MTDTEKTHVRKYHEMSFIMQLEEEKTRNYCFYSIQKLLFSFKGSP